MNKKQPKNATKKVGTIHVIVLAAGYATRLYPLTLEKPKPLLHVAGRPILEHILDKLSPIDRIERIHFVTNDKFSSHFKDWYSRYNNRHKFDFNFLNDGSVDETDKLGAIGDLHFALEQGGIDKDVLVVAGDNIFSEQLHDFDRFCREVNAPVIGIYDIGSLDAIKKFSAISADGQGKITFFEEKPQKPKSTLMGIALYYYPKSVLPLIRQYLAEGNSPDQPGRLVQWLYPRVPFYTWQVPGLWFDIGSKETLEEANRIFSVSAKLLPKRSKTKVK